MAESPTLTIRRDWPRPDSTAIEALRGAPTGFVVDAMGRSGALPCQIRPCWNGPAFVGTALTVWSSARDNLAPYAALRFARPGDVMMIQTGDYAGAAVIGDLIIGMMRNAGVVAVVTDGLVRDVPGIVEVGLPTYARGVSPNSPFKNGPGTIGLPIALGPVVIEAGDVVVGDGDGVVVVPAWRLHEVIAALAQIRVKEAGMDALVKGGAGAPPWLDERLRAEDIRFVD